MSKLIGERPPVADASRIALWRMERTWGEPLFRADWVRPVFIHYAVDPPLLQPLVPYPLDVRDGCAYVSVVAFTMRGMRPNFGGRIARWACAPIATHEFLNVRTYVRAFGEPGICFLSEWLTNPLSCRLGPFAYALPYRLGRIQYHHRHEDAELRGTVECRRSGARFVYEGRMKQLGSFSRCDSGSLAAFLLERYTAFNACGRRRRMFRVWHQPWLQREIEVSIVDDELIRRAWRWYSEAKPVGGHYSPGAHDVWMGRPHRVKQPRCRNSVLSASFELP